MKLRSPAKGRRQADRQPGTREFIRGRSKDNLIYVQRPHDSKFALRFRNGWCMLSQDSDYWIRRTRDGRR